MYDFRNEVRLKLCMAQSAAIPWSSPRRPSLAALTAPSSGPFTSQQLVLSPPHLISPLLGLQLANDSSHSGNQNQSKATLKGFSLGNVVKLLISGPKSGGKLNTSWGYLQWHTRNVKGDDLMILEMSLSLPSRVIYGYTDKTNWRNNSAGWDWHTLNFRSDSLLRNECHSLQNNMILSLQAVKQEECVLAPIVNTETEQHVFTPYSPRIHYIFFP